MMFPHDLDLPCVANPEPFDAVIDLHEHRGRYGVRQRAIVQRARDVCGGCDVAERCEREFADAEGIIAGKTRRERAS